MPLRPKHALECVRDCLLFREAEGGMVRVRAGLWCLLMIGLAATRSAGQDSGHEHGGRSMQEMPGMNMPATTPDWLPSPHAGSGTAWEPASAPNHMWMTSRGAWNLMAHGVIFLSYDQQGGPRGAGKAESVNWA